MRPHEVLKAHLGGAGSSFLEQILAGRLQTLPLLCQTPFLQPAWNVERLHKACWTCYLNAEEHNAILETVEWEGMSCNVAALSVQSAAWQQAAQWIREHRAFW